MAVPQIDQVDRVFIPRNYIRQIIELLWEEWLQVCRMRIISRVFNLLRFVFR